MTNKKKFMSMAEKRRWEFQMKEKGMKKVTVYHVDYDLPGMREPQKLGRIMLGMVRANFPQEFKKVADVLVHGDKKEEVLERAFFLTNRVQEDWTFGMEVEAAPGPQRSTSVGDVMEVGGELFVVAPLGFEPLESKSEMVKREAEEKGFEAVDRPMSEVDDKDLEGLPCEDIWPIPEPRDR